jgi:hypothetical protein
MPLVEMRDMLNHAHCNNYAFLGTITQELHRDFRYLWVFIMSIGIVTYLIPFLRLHVS